MPITGENTGKSLYGQVVRTKSNIRRMADCIRPTPAVFSAVPHSAFSSWLGDFVVQTSSEGINKDGQDGQDKK
jgi:hypothetical protein